MTDLDIEIAMDALGEALKARQLDPDAVEEYLTSEAQRVAQEQRDEAS